MNKTFKVVEFDKIIDRLLMHTSSEPVIQRINNIEMLSLEKAREAQRETTEAVFAMLRQGNPPVNLSVPDVRGAVKRIQIGAILNPAELMGISRALYCARRMKTYLNDAGEDLSILGGFAKSLTAVKQLEDRINSVIISETEIADDASPELLSLRKKQRSLNAKIKELEEICNG